LRIFVVPTRPEVKVLDPTTGAHIPSEGAEVERSTYWLRRLRDGDVKAGEPKKAPRGKAAGEDS
jgi:hypothetical protein